MKKDLLTLADFETEDFDRLLARALELKKRHKQGIPDRPLAGKTLGLIFDKHSTRTRISYEAAMAQLGGTPIYISTGDTQMARNEPVKDTARVLSRFLDCLAIRTFDQELVEEFAQWSSIPIINALTDLYHPCQVLSDLQAVIEYKGGYKDLKIAWLGDGNNVAHSWINAAGVLGLHLVLACPSEYVPKQEILQKAIDKGRGKIIVTQDPDEAVSDADIVYTDVWASMGQECEQSDRERVFEPYQLNQTLLKKAKPDAAVMHCLPAHREEEITDEVMEGPNSILWDQAENKLHMHKAILEVLITGK